MEATQLYLVLFISVLASIGLRQFWSLFLRLTSRNLACFFTRYIQYPLLIQRRFGNAATRLQALCLVIYVASNLLVLLLGLHDVQQLEKRAALMAIINMVPLFIGGRTNPIADVLGISIQSYYFAHNLIGHVAIVEALLHSVIVLTLRPRPGPIATSGIIAFSTATLILITSIWIFRRFMGDLFHIFHALLALAVLIGVLWHVFSLFSLLAKVLVPISSALWMFTCLTRLLYITFRGRRVQVKSIETFPDMTVIDITTKHEFRRFPGAYFYVTFPGSFWNYDLWRSYPMMAIWQESMDGDLRPRVQILSLMISHQGRCARQLPKLETRRYLLLEGPYGQSLHLQAFENVALVANGVGILGVLPFASHLAMRRLHDDSIRRSMQEVPAKETLLIKSEKEWRVREKELLADEKEHAWKQQQLSRGQKKSRRKLEQALEAELRALKKERRLMNKERDEIQQRRLQAEKERAEIFSLPLFGDATRRLDVFWWLDHNDQVKWAEKHLRALQKLDPNNRLLVVWCIFPSPRKRGSEKPFQQSEHWLCIYPSPRRPEVYSMVMSTLETESQMSPGRMIVVCSGDGAFTNKIRSGVIDLIRPDRLVEFAEGEFQLRTRGSYAAKTSSLSLSTSSEPGRHIKADVRSDDESFMTRTSTSSFGAGQV